MADHDALIDRLSRAARPVRRPLPAGLRTAAWMAAALPCGALATLALHRVATDWSRPGGGWAALQLALALAAGGLAILTAFEWSIAGRRAVAGKWVAPVIAAWLATSLGNVAMLPSPMGVIGARSYCYVFMVVASLPMIVLYVASLRRTRTLYPDRCLAAAGLGIAFMTAALLALCHPVRGHLWDFLAHLAAGATIIAITVAGGRRWVAVR
ncbi:MAG: hypothetical protein PW843_04185 [Azospirillaceae bacterium]|nr:hypothetical protein [Azospirillaceae bacterium]